MFVIQTSPPLTFADLREYSPFVNRFTKLSLGGSKGTDTCSQLYSEVGRRIRKQRTRLGMTQQELADAVNLTRPSIANIESGRQCFLVHTLFEIALTLEMNPHELLLPLRTKSTPSLSRVIESYNGVGHHWIREALGSSRTEG
jgi:transcriptional regulator with XRE-family HTH domain